eukprot:gb/GFBE01033678.1/.p1 GENE.gb/GFBE01033678.1/~~gb/GFBE01033678.1/.p1  ORF type:complete len:513 (+),score=102.76 gb/GFBE01033678.1/:1-1539(+)
MQTMDLEALANAQTDISDEDSFVLCDVAAKGFPILYASQGFQDIYGYRESECAGLACGTLVGCQRLQKEKSPELYAVGNEAGLDETEVEAAVELMGKIVSNFVQDMIVHKAQQPKSVVLLNRKSNGQLFSCEMALQLKHHPILDWSYAVGLQHDITADVSVAELLRAAAQGPGTYEALCARRGQAGVSHAARLARSKSADRLHAAMQLKWREVIAAQVADVRKSRGEKRGGAVSVTGHSITSLSTACTLSDEQVLLRTQPKSATCSPAPACHLGAIVEKLASGESSPSTPPAGAIKEQPRFLDLLEDTSEHSADECEWGTGARLETEAFACARLEDSSVSLVVVDPKQKNLPIVLASRGFGKLYGRDSATVVGQSFRRMIQFRDQAEKDEQSSVEPRKAQLEAAEFWASARQGRFWEHDRSTDLPALPDGELLLVNNLTAASGKVVACAVLLKQLELDDEMFVVALFQEQRTGISTSVLEELDQHLNSAMQIMAAEFWVDAPMRRQMAEASF